MEIKTLFTPLNHKNHFTLIYRVSIFDQDYIHREFLIPLKNFSQKFHH